MIYTKGMWVYRMGMRILNLMVRSHQTPEDLFIVPCTGSKKRQKRSHENHYVPEKVLPRVRSASYWAFYGKADSPRPEGNYYVQNAP